MFDWTKTGSPRLRIANSVMPCDHIIVDKFFRSFFSLYSACDSPISSRAALIE